MNVLMTGGTGFIGTALLEYWNKHAGAATQAQQPSVTRVYVLSRTPDKVRSFDTLQVVPLASLDELAADTELQGVINLAGAPILDKRWSEARKQLLYDSRLEATDALLRLFERLEKRPDAFISGSAVGFYGNQSDDRFLTEQEEGRPCFAHKLCHDWENKALLAEEQGIRVCLLRTGIVIGPGGALDKMLLPFKLGLGGPIGNGRQWMSWIDLADMVRGIDFLLHHRTLAGPFNMTAPEPVTNRTFSKTLAAHLHRPCLLPMPAWALQLMLGEGAELLTEGQRVLPEHLLEAGYEFHYPTLDDAFKHWL